MKKTFLRSMLALVMTALSLAGFAQTKVLNENFEGNALPSGWSAGNYWLFQDAQAVFEAPFENGADTLIAPLRSLAELDNEPSVLMEYRNVASDNGKVNTLQILYRAGNADNWSVLVTIDEKAEDWTSIKKALPKGLSNVQIAIVAAYNFGPNTAINRIAIENKSEATTAPTGLHYEDLTTTSVTLWWDVCSSPKFVQYNVKVNSKQMSDMSQVADIVDKVDWEYNDEFMELDKLNPNTSYWLYVQYDCGDGDLSPWAELEFRTPCEAIANPYLEDFEGDLSSCYQIIANGTAKLSSEYPYNSNQSFKFVSSKGKFNYLILPEMKVPIKGCQVTFMAAAQESGNSYARDITIGVCTEQTSEAFNQLKTVSLPKGRQWEQVTISFAGYSGNAKYIAFRAGNDDKENRIFIDDVRIEAASSCPKPMFVNITETTDNSAKIAWVEAGNANEWNLVISTKELSDPEDLNPDKSKGEFAGSVSTNPYQATGLKANTTYYVYVQAGCGSSEWTVVRSFTTAKAIAYPYREAFDRMPADMYTNKAGAIPDGWVVDSRMNNSNSTTNYDAYSSSYLPFVMTTQNHAPSAYVNASLQMKGTGISSPTSTTGGYTSIAMLPAMPKAVKNMQISFWALSTNGAHDIKIGVASTQTADLAKGKQLGENITEVATVTLGKANEWVKLAANLSSYTGEGRYITLYIKPGTATPTIFIDDIVVEDIACGEVTEMNAEAVNATSARAMWNDISSATSWKVKVASKEIDPASQNGDIANQTVSEKEYTATGLQPATKYYFYISPACANRWEMVEATTMNLSGTIIPYYNDFTDETSGYGTSAAPVRGPKDWKLGYTYADTYTYNNANAPYVYSTAWKNLPYGIEKNSVYFYNKTTANSQYPYAVMPEVTNANIKDLTVSFYAYSDLTANLGTTANPYISQIKIGVVESMNDINKENKFSKVTNVATVNVKASTIPQVCVVNMSAYTGSGKHIVFYQDLNKENKTYIDNLSITLTSANALQPVSEVAVSNITTNSVQVNWTENGNATQWDVRAFTSAQAEPEDGTPAVSTIAGNGAQAVLEGLQPSTKYFVYVRAKSGNNYGVWGGPVSFYTECAPIALPFYEDWNSYEQGGTSNNTFSPCYGVSHSSSSNQPYPGSYTKVGEYHPSRTNLLWMEATSANKVSQLEFPQLAAPVNTLQVELEASGYSSEFGNNTITYFGVVTSDGTFHKVAERKMSAAKVWENWVIDFSSYDLATYGDGLIAFRMDYNATGLAKSLKIGIENVKISVIPQCRKLQGADMSAENIKETTATVSWPEGGASKWNVKVSSTPLANPATDAADAFTGEVNTTPSKALTDLMDNTKYYVYVQVVRPDVDCVGEWSTPFSFKTLCFPRQFPYEEDFENYNTGAGNLPDCSNICGEDAEHSYITTKNGSKVLWIQQKKEDHKNYFVFPALNSNDIRKLQLSMQVYVGTTATSKYYYQVGIMTDPNKPSTFVALHTEELQGSSNPYDRVYKFDGYQGDESGKFGGYVAITPQNYITNAGKTGYSSLYIDNVVIDIISTCVAPINQKVDSIGTNGIKFIWSTDDASANHRVRIFDSEDAKPNSSAFVAEAVVKDSVAVIEGLTGNTVYYAYVRKECAADDNSKWSSAVKFITNCEDKQSLPYVEGFEGRPYANITDKAVPACWTNQTIQGTGTYFCYYSSTAKKDGDYGLYLYYTVVDEHAGGSDVGTHRSAIVTPALDVNNLSELLVYFDAKAVSTTVKGSIKIEAVSDETTNAEAIYITTIEDLNNAAWKKGYVRIKDFYNSAKPFNRLRFTPSANTSVYIDNMVFTKDLDIVFPVENLKMQMITDNSIKISFDEITPVIKQWQVAYVAEGGEIADATVLDIDATDYTITGLPANTYYDIYVRGNVSGDEWVGPLAAHTLPVPVGLPYSTGFEDDADMWNLYNVQTVQGDFYPNFFIMGDAANCEGTGAKALFVTNDSVNWQSWGNHLPDGTTTATSYIWATRDISIPSAGTYKFSFKIKAPVAYSSHGVCAQLMPAGATIKAGEATLLNGNKRKGNAAADAPADNCYTVMKQLFATSDWIWYSQALDIVEPGTYTLAFYWYNSAAGAKKEQPAAVDSVKVEEYLCTTPKDIKLVDLSATHVSLKWFAGKCNNFDYVLSQYRKLGDPAGIDAADKVAYGSLTEGPQVVLGDLNPSTDYAFYVRTQCPDAATDWVEFDFTTPCLAEVLPYTEIFTDELDCWKLNAATISTVKYLTQDMKNAGQEADVWSCLQLNKGGLAILPELNVPLTKVNVEIGLFNSTNLGAVSIGVMDNSWDASTFEEVYFCQTASKLGSTNSSGNPYEVEVFQKMLNLYQGTGKILALKNMTENAIYVKYVTLRELPDCVQPQQIELTYLTENSVVVNWIAGVEDKWDIQLNNEIISNVTTNPYKLENLEQGTSYTVAVRAICDNEHKSEWSQPAQFVTICGVNPLPMVEDFSGLPQPNGSTDLKRASLICWDNFVSDGNIDQVFKGKAAPYQPASNLYVGDVWVSNWIGALGGYAQLHSYRRDAPKNRYKWFISPQYAIEGQAILSFAIRVCNNKGERIESNPDRTVVAISTDNGATWKEEDATVIEDIDSVYTTKSIKLDKYAGQAIRIAFYDENVLSSHKINQQPFILIDSVRINCAATYNFNGDACEGYDYEGNGFNIKKEDLPLAGESTQFTRFAKAKDEGCDSTIILTLTTYTAQTETVYESICKGEPYEFGGKQIYEPNPEGKPYFLNDQTVHGCDSTIYLYLTVVESDTTDFALTLKQNELPYDVMGFYTIPEGTPVGTYEDVIKISNDCQFLHYIVKIEDVPSAIEAIAEDIDRIEVYDYTGKLVQVLHGVSLNEMNVPAGIYMLRAYTVSGQMVIDKAVVK